jgi:ArsR family transcriptional regulator
LSTTSAVNGKARTTKSPGRRHTKLPVSEKTLEGLTDIFHMLADESRLKILLVLAKDGEMNVSALCKLLRQSQPAVSHHLTLLRMNKLVGFRRDGKKNFYRIDSARCCDLLEQFFSDSGNGHKQILFQDFALAYRRK